MSRTPRKPPVEAKLTVPDEATQREVMELWNQVDRLARHGGIPAIRAGAVQPQDKDSGLVKYEWVRRVRPDGKRQRKPAGDLRQWTLEGEEVTATFTDRHGGLHQVSGVVARNAAGELVVRGWAEGVVKETAVPRDANVDVKNAKPSR